MANKWVNDISIQIMMDELGWIWSWQPRNKIQDIDLKASLHNNARLGESIDEDHMLRMAQDLKNGKSLPGIVLRKIPGKRKLYVLAGNHRILAVQLNDYATIGGYVVECSDEDAEDFVRSDNRKHGLGVSDKEAYEQVYYLHKKDSNRTIAELARLMGLNFEKTRQQIRISETRDELEQAQIDTANLADSTLTLLYTIRHNATVMQRAAHLAATYKMAVPAVKTMLDQVKAQRGQVKANIVLSKWEGDLKLMAAGSKTKRRNPPKRRFLDIIFGASGSMRAILRSGNKGKPIQSINDIYLNVDEAINVLDAWAEIEAAMSPILKECVELAQQYADANGKPRVSKRKQKKKHRQ
jgi:hypothetical protein